MNDRPRDLDAREQQRLRELLDDATSDVHPHDGLDSIRSRTKVSPMSTRPWMLGAAAAVLATAATVTAVAVLGGGTPQAGPGPAADPSTTVASPPASETPDDPGPVETDAPEGPVAVEGAVPVYYLGDTGQGPRLYREFHPGIGGPAFDQAIADAVSRAPDDPDYRNPWPAGTSITGTVTDGKISRAHRSRRRRPESAARQDVAGRGADRRTTAGLHRPGGAADIDGGELLDRG